MPLIVTANTIAECLRTDGKFLEIIKKILSKTLDNHCLVNDSFSARKTKANRSSSGVLFREKCWSRFWMKWRASWPVLSVNIGRVKADSYIACHAHAVPLPCRAAKGLECVFLIWFTHCDRVCFTLATAQHDRRDRAVLCRGLEKKRHGQSMAWARHGKCESDTAALCKSNGKDTFLTLSDTAWQGNGMGAAWARHAMCESAFIHS